MTSEDIIQRLLDENKITVKEALVLLKDLAKIAVTNKWNDWFPGTTISSPEKPFDNNIVVMYGVNVSPFTYDDTYGTTNSISSNIDDDDKTGQING